MHLRDAIWPKRPGKKNVFCTMTMLSHFPHSATVFGEKQNVNHHLANIFSRSVIFLFSQDARLYSKAPLGVSMEEIQ
jgi:hypothetical protein